MKVSDLMVREVVTCRDDETLHDAVRLFWDKNVGFLPVVSAADGTLRGVLTDRDVAICAYFEGKPLWQIPVRNALSPRCLTVLPDAEIDEAEQLLAEHQFHRLPVVDADGRLIGIVSIADIARRAAATQDAELEEEAALTMGAIVQPRYLELRR